MSRDQTPTLSLGNGGDFSLQFNEYSHLLEECGIPLPESDFCKRSDLDTIFIAANYEEDRNSEDAKLNDDNSLMRFEYIETLVRIAVARFIRTVPDFPKDICLATQKLIAEVIQPNMPPEACVDSNDFRRNRLYFEEMDLLYDKHLRTLKVGWDSLKGVRRFQVALKKKKKRRKKINK